MLVRSLSKNNEMSKIRLIIELDYFSSESRASKKKLNIYLLSKEFFYSLGPFYK